MSYTHTTHGTLVRRQPTTLSFRATRNDRSNLRAVKRRVLQHDITATNSSVIRDALDLAARSPDVMEERARGAAREAELAEALEAARLEAARERRLREAADKKSRKSARTVERLLIHLPVVRDLAGSRSLHRSGIAALDNLWLKCARSWPRVLKRLQDAQNALDGDDRGGTGPPDPGGGS